MGTKILVVVKGMFLPADSIAYDAAFHYRCLRSLGLDVEVFVDRFVRQHYTDVPARPMTELEGALSEGPTCVIYHWIDGCHEIDARLRESGVPTVVRWHNNTPPWFFAPYSPIATQNTVRGFDNLLRFAEQSPAAQFWANSEFSRRQLIVLGIDASRISVVFPASFDLEYGTHDMSASSSGSPLAAVSPAAVLAAGTSAAASSGPEIRLLFVGRIVPHKGQKHVLAAAHALQLMSGRTVRVAFPGPPDPDMPRYAAELRGLGLRLGVPTSLPGQVSRKELARAYEEADVFVGLSEHEGFGLPIIEAMARRRPVVGYRSSAVAELLSDHPLACDTLDPVTVARRILAVVDDRSLCAKIVDWQVRTVLQRYDKTVIEGQLGAGLRRLGVSVPAEPPRLAPASSSGPPREEVEAALERTRSIPASELDLPITLVQDLPNHLVTRYDVAAYQALLKLSANGSLRNRALDLEFGSHRQFLGKFLSLLKRMSLRLQDGLLRTIEISHNDLEHDLAALSDKIDLLAAELSRRRSSPAGDGGAVSRRTPEGGEHDEAPPGARSKG